MTDTPPLAASTPTIAAGTQIRRKYPDHPIVGVLAVVLRGEQALLVARANAPNKGRWGFPGGVLELGETVAEGAMRELLEETSVSAEPGETLTVLDAVDRDAEGRIRYHYVLIAIAATWRSGEGIAGDDAGAVAWLTRQEIIAQNLWIAPALIPILDMALAKRG